MQAGELDRRVRLLRLTVVGQDAGNADIRDWVEIGKRWAKKVDLRDAQRTASQRDAARGVADVRQSWFTMRDDGLTRTLRAEDRIEDQLTGVAYDITGIKEAGGRRAFLEFTAASAK